MIHINILKTASRVTEDPYFGDFAALFLINSSCEVLIISVILSDQSLEITMNKRLLLVSNSTLHGGGYLQHCQQQIQVFFGKGVKRILFVPYALHDRDAYTKTARDKFKTLGYEVDSVHETPDPVEAVRKAEGIFIGGGNTFRLLKALYDNKLVTEIRKRVLDDGIPYMGSSAGTNVSTISINTTNDMPIVYPPTFAAIGLVPFNINPHYLDADPNSKHMGETREQRIIQFHEEPDTPCVLALREGCMLIVEGNKATLLGCTKARLFQKGKQTTEYEPGSDLSFLLTDAQNI
ncbi:alpha-aspartyl dipeptidase-like isoform X2 [Xyrauchen texanus]|uniref:alpha-aspartyl dipeptidase-like isoform X2 n=1 Tax=Xyrauchen texanus TaxID=154827 RepID=UPI0022418D75|nr:alpha-aspartyl dipeptidase-like isoform X2 [Xyrauchen texanus]